MDIVLSLSPEQARAVGGWALLGVVVLDVLASSDEVPFNTPRDWLLWLTQWRSLGLWSKQNRDMVRRARRHWAPFLPINYLPLTGAAVPFMCAALIGHFFHPGLEPVIGPGGFAGLGISLVAALSLSVATYFWKPGGSTAVFWIALGGLVGGAIVWPVTG